MQVVNIDVKSKSYLLKLIWYFSYSFMHCVLLIWARLLKTKYKKFVMCKSSSIWPNISNCYYTILNNIDLTISNGD